MVTIRSYKPADAAVLAAHFNELCPVEQVTAWRLNGRLAAWSLSWVVCVAEQPVGYACAAPLPGLPGQYDLDVMIALAWQRQGLGSQLVAFLKQALAGSEVRSLNWGVTENQSSVAAFLRRSGFTPEHEELILARPHLEDLPPAPLRPHLAIRTYARREAIALFCRLYETAFAGLPWYQPYTLDEAAADLAAASDILFLAEGKRPFGFAWLHIDDTGEGKIEPIGLIPEKQGRGNGRFLFISALHTLKQRGADRALIGAWTHNTAALNLYHSLGFNHQQTIAYYTCSLHS
ncbi:MAG: GNAT family N-acetyltransferase [Chloroflexota bacterium]